MKILELQAENFKKIRVVEIRPDRRLVQVTGKNGAGKTSTLDAIWFGLKGKKALPTKAVRKGAERMKVMLKIGPSDAKEDLEFTVTRTLGHDSETPTLDIKMLKGKRDTTPQEFLDNIIDALTFDPLEFVNMDSEEQVTKLKETAKIDLDFDAIADANKTDYDARRDLNKEISRLDLELAAMVVSGTILEGLPAEKLDESAIMARMDAAAEANRQAQEIFKAKQDLGAKAATIGAARFTKERDLEQQGFTIGTYRAQLKAAEERYTELEKELQQLAEAFAQAETAFREAPAGEPVDLASLTRDLQDAQRTNRAIDSRRAYDAKKALVEQKSQASRNLTTRMEQRDEERRIAVSKAKIPIEGLGFNDAMTQVTFNGLPLENLGEGEQIRISALIGMAANPKLRVLCIRHGEALDEDGLQVLAQLAEEHDFQIWMARVDSSGKVGIVLEDGMVARRNEEA